MERPYVHRSRLQPRHERCTTQAHVMGLRLTMCNMARSGEPQQRQMSSDREDRLVKEEMVSRLRTSRIQQRPFPQQKLTVRVGASKGAQRTGRRFLSRFTVTSFATHSRRKVRSDNTDEAEGASQGKPALNGWVNPVANYGWNRGRIR